MGKSRKGKKAWRSNISTQDIEDFYDKSTKDALSGGSLTQLPSDSLFFLDKSRDLSVKRKIDKSRDKILRVDSVLQKNSFVKPVPSSNTKKCSRNYKEKDLKTTEATSFKKKDASTMLLDIWNDQGDHAVKKRKVSNKAIVIPAVEVEPPGCSYNPTSESHQDSLAQAVADEMQKVYTKELRPAPVPLTVEGGVIDEEDMYFLDADNESDDDVEGKDADENDDADLEKRPFKTKRVTRVQLNKRARNKEKLKMEAEAKKIKDFSKDLDSLPDIIDEIGREDEEKKNRHLRCVTAKQERLKSCPPRLGRHKFEPAPVQVLLSEEITGSLRKLKACCTLARDRYKSFEKRGIIVPTAKSGRK
ncbi:putative ribosome biogenesis protein Nop53/GLTSCR2 [Helianthus annuus]|uniref:Ribosome biogenesis protein NOP53 n=1 Tax=Helianthus annuus TaxID=4232 RepID=A0A251U941_HELAN|nr:ribosome biogenesis protein NOP53 [Helianthus annuus]KAF5797388.1 putative ribosome biogenesis protein Nop53/GLTSCR2 [Helianthus annuus]KAJ0549143.1 putative ribosome biogenesis protein Nop53/GLTSCR2 [Helianthus annuus]KAJ0562092.1 putative ribosome biogenesis protein Nop53/GLTSCR2 [Helianthus annuus]KAJ0730264.1 putative ribosome biogenesis protein Nop53/GLTSCR2 [Helianthus annuus]KAJ0903569.1 putative ribosome biogenesis protein Nop53/GLTSCR2 [Helianthus annuus]